MKLRNHRLVSCDGGPTGRPPGRGTGARIIKHPRGSWRPEGHIPCSFACSHLSLGGL